MRKIWFCLPVLFCAPFAHGQSAIDFAVGGGTATDSANHSGIDNGNSPTNPFGSLGNSVPNTAADPYCEALPKMSGFFLGFTGDIMFKEHFGAGAEVSFQPAHQSYGPFQYRETFIDVNGIYEPITKKRAVLQLQAGIGSAKTGLAYSQDCTGITVCSSASQPVTSFTHFQVHSGAGVQIAVTDHIFLRPQFDIHYVPSLTNQFGSNWVPEYTVWLGYHFGEK